MADESKRDSARRTSDLIDELSPEDLAEFMIDLAMKDIIGGIDTIVAYYAKHPTLVRQRFYELGVNADRLNEFLRLVFSEIGEGAWNSSFRGSSQQ